jgi:membrane protease YdiL (CAAX protease family)
VDSVAAGQATGAGKARYVWRVVGYFVLLAIINTITFEIEGATSSFLPSWVGVLLEGLFYLATTLALTWAFCRFLDRSSLSQLGLQKRGWFAYLGAGLGLGALLMILVFSVLWAAGWLAVDRSDSWQSPAFVASVLTWIVISFVEELSFRGYILQGLARAWGMPVAVAMSSVLFAAVHALNPNASVLGVLNIIIVGVLLACAYLVTRSLWLPVGLHIGWNLVEIQLLGFPGSGHTEPSIVHTIPHGPELMTGGAFGPEGGIVALAAALLGIAILLISHQVAGGRKNRQENQ